MEELRARLSVNADGRVALKYIDQLRREVEYSMRTNQKIEMLQCIDSIKHLLPHLSGNLDKFIKETEGYLDEYQL